MSAAPRLYLVTPQGMDAAAFAPILSHVLASVPVACVRLSLPGDADEAAWTLAANHLLPVCHDADVALVLTDHYRLVAPLGLDGVHLAAGRTQLRDVRTELGRDRIVGAFAGASRHQGMVLAEAGADYVSFGPVGATGALGGTERAEDDLFQWWAEMIETPSVAEGDVKLADAERLNEHADFVMPGAAIWDEDDPAAIIAQFAGALPAFD